MLIYSIMLDNFRQYKGSNFITFSTDPEKNVTVITGENTCGKTTLVQSFIWCFYGHVDFKDKRILNTEVAEKLKNNIIGAKETATVRVNLSHDGINYLIERKEITKVITKDISEEDKATFKKVLEQMQKNCSDLLKQNEN
mgnify:CR=1 FL=1